MEVIVPLDDFEKKLVTDHIALSVSVAVKVYRTAPHALELDEMKAISFFGLVDAASKWNDYCLRLGYDRLATAYFMRYASLRCAGACFDRIRSNDWATRSLREKQKKINAVPHNENMSVSELIEVTGLTEKEVRNTLIGLSKAPISLDVATQGLEGEEGEGVGLQLAETQDVESKAFVADLLSSFANAVLSLPEQQRLLVVLHYYSNLELKKCAAVLGVPSAVVSQLHTKAMLSLLEALELAAS